MHVSGDCVACKWRYPPFVTLILNKFSGELIVLVLVLDSQVLVLVHGIQAFVNVVELAYKYYTVL